MALLRLIELRRETTIGSPIVLQSQRPHWKDDSASQHDFAFMMMRPGNCNIWWRWWWYNLMTMTAMMIMMTVTTAAGWFYEVMAGVRYKRYSPPEALWLPTTTAMGNFFYFFGIWNNTCSPIALEGTHRDLIKGGQTTHSKPTSIKPYKTQHFLDLLRPGISIGHFPVFFRTIKN